MDTKHPEEYINPIQVCFDLLKLANIGFFDANQSFFKRQWRSFYIVAFILIHFVCMSCYMKTSVLKLKISKLAFMMSAYLITGQVFYWVCLVAAWQNLISPLLITALQKYKGKEDLQLPFGYCLPFTLNIWSYLAIYVFQCYTMFRLVYIYLGTELLKIILCAYLSIEFMLLQEDLKCISKGKTSEELMRSIKIVIRRHQVLINLSFLLNKIFNQMIFFDLLFATMTACFFAFAATCTRDSTLMASNLSAVFGILIPIYIYCYYSTVLGEESSRIADAVYEDLWYQGDMDYQKTICFIIARSYYPCYLTALKRVPITLLTFSRVVSTTWSYFSLANSLYSE